MDAKIAGRCPYVEAGDVIQVVPASAYRARLRIPSLYRALRVNPSPYMYWHLDDTYIVGHAGDAGAGG
jgi:anthranilate/para-aminobenzoate synthase component I